MVIAEGYGFCGRKEQAEFCLLLFFKIKAYNYFCLEFIYLKKLNGLQKSEFKRFLLPNNFFHLYITCSCIAIRFLYTNLLKGFYKNCSRICCNHLTERNIVVKNERNDEIQQTIACLQHY